MIVGFGSYGTRGGRVRAIETASRGESRGTVTKMSNRPRELANSASNMTVSSAALGGMTSDDLALSYVGGSSNDKATQAAYAASPEVYKYYASIFREDGVCGAAVELRANIPYSSFKLSGMKDAGKLAKYNNAIENMRLESMMSRISIDRDAMGAFFGALDWNSGDKAYDSMIALSRMDVTKILYSPVHGLDPVVDVMPSQLILDLLQSTDPRTANLKKCIPNFMQAAGAGASKNGVPVPMDSVVWLARPHPDQRFNSLYHRILPVFLIERALTRGTIDGSHKRQKPILHIQMGQGEDWMPTGDEMNEVSSLFTDADADPIGAIVATRDGININEVRSPQDFWKITDIADQTLPFKLRALGVSEAFLSSDASFANADSAISVFMETVRSERSQVEKQLFYDKLFPQIGIANGFYKTGAVGKGERSLNAITNMNRIEMPTIVWAKSLAPEGDAAYLEMLNGLAEKGVPITIRLLAAAGGFDLDKLLEAGEQDLADRKLVAALKEKIKELNPEADDEQAQEFARALAGVDSNPLRPMGILNRDYGDLDRFEAASLDHRGKRQATSTKWRKEFREASHKLIARVAAATARKENYLRRQAGTLVG